MTVAVLLAAADDAEAAQRYADTVAGESVLGRLVRQLRSAGVGAITVAVSPAARAVVAGLQLGHVDVVSAPGAVGVPGPVLVAPADLVCHDRVLTMALSGGSRAVVAPADRPGERVRVEYGLVVPGDGGPGVRTLTGLSVEDGDSPVRAVEVRGFVCERVRTDADVARVDAALRTTDEDALWLAAAVKADDSPVATYLVSSWSPYLVRRLARLGVAPTAVTVASLALGAAAAFAFATGSRGWIAVGAVALLAAFALDCVDGQLARYTRRFSAFGGWLDAVGDRAKEYGAYAGLAAGWSSAWSWPLATTLLVAQTTRHLADFAYAESRMALSGGADDAAGIAGTLDATGRLRALRRVVILPIGERFLLLAITAVIGGAALAFPVVLVGVLVAGAYMVLGRILRSLAPLRHGAVAGASRVADLRDDGPLVDTVVRLAGRGHGGAPGILPRMVTRLSWLAVPLLRAVEYAVVAVLARAADVPWPWVYGCLAALAFHHYDVVYRLRQGRPRPTWRRALTLGWDGRLVLVLVAAAAGGLGVVVPVIAVAVAVVFLAESSLTWATR